MLESKYSIGYNIFLLFARNLATYRYKFKNLWPLKNMEEKHFK